MSRFCIDTSAYSRFRMGDAGVVDLLESADWIGVPTIVLGELWAGFLMGVQAKKNEAELREFLAHPMVEPVGVDPEAARIYGEIVVDLRRVGTPLPTNDIWIAAIAARTGSTVLTFDAHFRAILRAGSRILPA